MGMDTRIVMRTASPISEEKLKLAGYDLAAALPDLFARARHYNERKTIELNGNVYEIDIWCRYYGPGYERGPFPLIYAALLWLKNRFPECRLYYFGDSYELDEVSEMSVGRLQEFLQHWLDVGNQPYQRSFGEGPTGCEQCARPLINVGGGGGNEFYSCMACERRFIQTSTKELIPVEDFSTRKPEKETN